MALKIIRWNETIEKKHLKASILSVGVLIGILGSLLYVPTSLGMSIEGGIIDMVGILFFGIPFLGILGAVGWLLIGIPVLWGFSSLLETKYKVKYVPASDFGNFMAAVITTSFCLVLVLSFNHILRIVGFVILLGGGVWGLIYSLLEAMGDAEARKWGYKN